MWSPAIIENFLLVWSPVHNIGQVSLNFLSYFFIHLSVCMQMSVDNTWQGRCLSVWHTFLDWKRYKSGMLFVTFIYTFVFAFYAEHAWNLHFFGTKTWYETAVTTWYRMKLEQQLLKLLNLMLFLEGVQFSTGNFKAMNLTNFCPILSLVLYHWRGVLHLDLEKLRKKSLKHGCMYAKENELSEWSRYSVLPKCIW